MTESLVDILLRWWRDTLTIREADPDALELTCLEGIEELDRRDVARGAWLYLHRKELRDLRALAHEMRRALDAKPPEDTPDG